MFGAAGVRRQEGEDTMAKRIISVLLALVLAVGLLPLNLYTTAWAEETDAAARQESTELLEGYFYQLAGMDITDYRGSTNGIVTKTKYSAGDNLTTSERQVYNAMKPEIIRVANGQRSGTRFSVPTSLAFASVRRVVTALMMDLPYEMYWFGKSLSGALASSGYTISLKVARDFRGSNEYTTNIPNVPNAVRVAKSVVSSNGGKGDYEKLEAYKDYICAHNTYNSAAANGQYDGNNPWELLWVFDNDPSTNVVCEGYSKAFKYLCDLTKEQYGWYGSVEARLTTGSAGGPHMWNTVSFHGGNYLVDVTNCDGGFDLFMRGATSQTAGSSYRIGNIYYTLDDDTKSVYTRTELTLSSTDCSGVPRQITGIRTILPTNDNVVIGVSWNADSRATSYTVYRRESGSAQWQVLKSGITDTIYKDTNVEPGVTYYYTVEGVNGSYRSPTKDETGVSATIAIKTPANVTMTGAVPSPNGVTVTWQAAQYAKTYVVYRKPANTNSWAIIARSVSGTSYVDTAAAPSSPYTYTVRGVAADGKTMSSGYDRTGVTATASREPADVTLTGARITGSGITVTWQAALNASTYVVYRRTEGTGWSIVARSVSGTSYTDNTAAAGVPYTYTVRGCTAGGAMSKSYDRTGVTATVPKAADDVTLIAARINGRQIVVTWQPANGAHSYVVYRKVTGTNNWAIVANSVTGTSYTDGAAQAGVSYTYTVRGRGGDGVLSKHYDPAGVTAGIPANVTLTSATASGTAITVAWQPAANAQSYTVYRKATGTNNWAIIAKSVEGTRYTDAAVTPGTSYTYTVRGVASDGRSMSLGYDGRGVSAAVNTTPANVTLTAARAGTNGITVTWQAANGAASYTVYRKVTGTNSWAVVANAVNGVSYTDGAAQAGVSYTYTVRGRAASGAMSPSYDRTGVSSGIPADVALTAARAGTDSITVTWKTAANAASYAVYRRTVDEQSWTCLAASVTGTSYTDTTAARDVDYVYTVRGVRDSALSLGCDENGVAAGLYTVPDDVVLLGAASSKDCVTVTWEPAAYAQSYRVYRRVDGGVWTVLADRVTGTSFRDTTFEQGQAYYYTVRALNRTKISSGYDRTGVTATAYYRGTCGDGLAWDLDPETGLLTIRSTASDAACRMPDYTAASPAPWHTSRETVRTIQFYIDDGCTLSIGAEAFSGCTALETVYGLPAGLTAIGADAFSGCAALTDVYYGDDGHAWEQVTGSENALPAQTKLHTKGNLYESGTLSNGLRWELALTEKSGLLTITGSGVMPDFPSGARTTDWYPYRDKVTVAIVSQGITSVGDNAFRDSTALDLVSIAGSVTSVGDDAFRGCSALRKIQFRGKGADWDAAIAGADTGIPSTTVVEYLNGTYDSGTCGQDLTWILSPDGVLTISGTGSMTDYSSKSTNTTDDTRISTAPWAAHTDRIRRLVIEEGVTSASKYAFCGLTALTAVTLPDSLSAIDWNAFQDCRSLTGITIPSSVTTIGFMAFQDCRGLTSITLPDSVTSLDDSVFWGCRSLTAVTLPAGLTSIGDYLFAYCTSLTNITIPSGVTTIGESAFYRCEALVSIDLPSGVTTIGASAFAYCEALTSIALPSGVTAISDSTFKGCEKLTSVTIPARLKTVGASAFENCKALTAIDLPDSLTALGASAFKGCEKLASVQAACSAAIGKEAFSGCTALTEVSLTGRKISLESGVFSGCTSLKKLSITGAESSVGDAAVQCCQSLIAADLSGVVSVGTSAFEGCTSLTSVRLPNAASIGDGAFRACDALAEVTFPTVSTAIGADAFRDCPALTEARITAYSLTLGQSAFYNSGLQWISITGKITAIEPWTFSGCPLRVMCIPDGVTSIGYRAFYNCKELCSIYIPDSVKSIDNYAFTMEGSRYDRLRVFYGNDRYNWNTLTADHTSGRLKNASVTYGYGRLSANDISGTGSCGPYEMGKYDKVQWTYTADGTLTIRGSGPMNDFRRMSGGSGSEWYTRPWTVYMPAVHSVVIEEGLTSVGSCAFCEDSGQLATVQLPESLTSIGQGAFGTCTALRSVSIPKNVTTIGHSAFSDCTSLTSITIPEGVTAIDAFTFSGCTSLGTVKLPATLTTIGDYAFYGCRSLRTADLPAALTSIGSSAFSNCALKSVSISDAVTCIEREAFFGCTSLASVTLGKSLTKISEKAFYNCSSLTSIVIPEGVTTIGESAFAGCTSLASVVIPDSVTSIGENAFSSCTTLATVKLGGGLTSIEAGLFDGCPITDLTISEGVTTIGERAFAGGKFQKLTLPDSLKTIGPSAFSGCADLTSVTFGSSLTTIGERAFANCKLYSVKLPDSVRTLGAYAFSACTSMTGVTLNSVTTIGERAFSGCNRLSYADIPKTVTSLGAGAFAYTQALLRVDAGNPNYISEDGAVWSKDKTVLVDGRKITEADYVIPSTVTTIEAYAFTNNRELLTVKIPASVTTIGAYAFTYCLNLTTVTNLTKVRRFEEGVFSNCWRLSSIYAGDVHYFGTKAFSNCSNLKTVSTRALREMGDSVFYKCTSLQEISIPNTVKSIGKQTFYGCKALKRISIPPAVTAIGDAAFYECKALSGVYYGGTEEQWSAITIGANNGYLTNAARHYNSLSF